MLERTDAAYVAGIFDGEGCVQVKYANGSSRSLICAKARVTNRARQLRDAA